MSRERWSGMLRWVGLALGAVVVALVLSARGSGGLPPRGAPGPLAAAAASGSSSSSAETSPYVPQTLHNLALGTGSGPFTSTVRAFSFSGDIRPLASIPPLVKPELRELEAAGSELSRPTTVDDPVLQRMPDPQNPAPEIPSPLVSFEGLDHAHAANVYPPDTNGDVGPRDFVQTVNDNVSIYSKTTGVQLANFSFDALFGSVITGTPCDNENRGDPVALYDARADRFIVADFAFASESAGPYYECIAASKTGDPVSGGWWLYALRADDDLHPFFADYPKLGVWTDGIYMSANLYDCSSSCVNEGVRVWALNRNDLFSGSILRAVFFNTSDSYFGLLPANMHGALPPPGTPNYFVANDFNSFHLEVFKFHVNYTTPLSSTFSINPTQVTIASYNFPPLTVPEQTGHPLDTLYTRLMAQNQYRKIGSIESLWVADTVGVSPTGLRWYQLSVTGGAVATTPVQQSTYAPDSSNRWVPSLAVDKSGDMLMGYSVSSASMHPAIRYAGRLVTDPVNGLSPEVTLIAGGGGQTVNCGGGACERWGDYSGMTVDPVDDCTFWYTTEYYATNGGNWHTRIGSIRFPSCGIPLIQHLIYVPLLRR